MNRAVCSLKLNRPIDSLGRLSKEEVQNSSNSAFIGSTEYSYDIRNNLTNLITNYGGLAHEQKYYYSDVSQNSSSDEYEKDNLPTMYKLYSSRYAVYDYDSLNRLTQRKFTLNTPLYYNYVYKKSDNRNTSGSEKYQTTQIKEEYIGNDVYIYGYDVLGNITSIKTATRSGAATATTHTTAQNYVTYSYDDLGQLTRENLVGKNTTVWDYDDLGNITAKTEYAYTTTEDLDPETATKTIAYGYGKDGKSGWNNLLTSVDLNGNGTTDSGETITYDKIGNPTTYLGATLTWNGRQLTSYSTDDKTITYTYDSNGLRASKTVNGVTSKYFYVNGQLHYEERSDGTKLYFFYDSTGALTSIEYNNTNYYPATNLKGDVVAIYNSNGVCVARYEYDAWGNIIAIKDASGNPITSQTHIANVNPIRYRGYYYDSETELYYLQSRYYNPDIGRFLNTDGYLTTGQGVLSYNMFAYCQNNPVMYSDPSGNLPEWAKKALNFIVDKVISIMTKSKNPKIKLCGDTLNAAKKGFEKGQKIMSIENPLTAPTAIKEQYVNDIENVGKNGVTVTKTPDPIIFPDVNEYNVRCQDMWDALSTSPVYSDLSGSYFDKTEAQNTIICWDYETCFDLCDQTIITTFTETMVDIMKVLYG